MIEVLLTILTIMTFVNLIISISNSMVIVKMYEFQKLHEEKQKFDDEIKLRTRGLLDINTSQIPYDR